MYKFSTNPFPYFIKDNAIDENLIDSMLKNWPEDNFVPEALASMFVIYSRFKWMKVLKIFGRM